MIMKVQGFAMAWGFGIILGSAKLSVINIYVNMYILFL